MEENKTIVSMLNDRIHEFCSGYCKYGHAEMTDREIDEVCGKQCPLRKIYGGEVLG